MIAAAIDASHDTNVIPFGPVRARRRDDGDAAVQATSEMRIVLVDWRITLGREADFLDYWSRREVVPERDGLIGEFLSRIDPDVPNPWITWPLDGRWTTFVNIGLWRTADDFYEQIGYKIDASKPPLPFEAEPRRRIFVAPERWRRGGTALPLSDHAQVS